MIRSGTVSLEDETWNILKEMRNSSKFVREAVKDALGSGQASPDKICAFCNLETNNLIWEGTDERWICEACFKRRLRRHVISGNGIFE